MNKLSLILLLLLLGPFFPNLINSTVSETKSVNTNDFINISGNTELSNFALSKKLVGNGTATNPYIIQNYIINSSYVNGINIQSTTSYLLIKNITITNLFNGVGIFIDNCQNVKLENNSIKNSYIGIEFESSGVNAINNTVSSSINEGILVNTSNGINISNNYLNSNVNFAINIQNSENMHIIDNIILNTDESGGSLFSKQDSGMLIDTSSNVTVQKNIIVASPPAGISISGAGSNILINSNILQNSQINLETGAVLSNIVISNNTLGSYWGTITLYSLGGALVENNTLFESDFPIEMYSQGQFNIKNNFICNAGHGMSIEESSYNIVTGNTFVNISYEDLNIRTLNNLESIDNKIYANNFLDKQNAIYQDNIINNLWNNASMGNYWGSYNGTDANNDGIGDQIFKLMNTANLNANVYDNYPLMSPIKLINNEYSINYVVNLLKPYGDLSWGYSNAQSYGNGFTPYIPHSYNLSAQQSTYNSSTTTNPEYSSYQNALIVVIVTIGFLTVIGLARQYSNRRIQTKNDKLIAKKSNYFNTSTRKSNKTKIKKVCPKCNAFIERSDVFCLNCGTKL